MYLPKLIQFISHLDLPILRHYFQTSTSPLWTLWYGLLLSVMWKMTGNAHFKT